MYKARIIVPFDVTCNGSPVINYFYKCNWKIEILNKIFRRDLKWSDFAGNFIGKLCMMLKNNKMRTRLNFGKVDARIFSTICMMRIKIFEILWIKEIFCSKLVLQAKMWPSQKLSSLITADYRVPKHHYNPWRCWKGCFIQKF